MQTSEDAYLNALLITKEYGNDRITRNGATRAIFAHQMRFDLQEGFPLLTTKEIKFESVKAELLWFIDAGRETGYRLSLKKLNEIQRKSPGAKNIWSHDQERFASQGKAQFEGDCGRIYGAQWRNWGGKIDQLAEKITAIKNNPFDRYHIITAWNPSDLHDMCLGPCHMKMQFFVRKSHGAFFLDLSMDQRSCDLFLGVPFNIASYALLLHMVAQCVDMQPGELVITLEDCHIYLSDSEGDTGKSHLAKVELQLSREPFPSPQLWLNPEIKDIDLFTMEDIKILNYQHHPFIKADLL